MRGRRALHAARAAALLGVALFGCSRSLGSDGPEFSLSGLMERSIAEPPKLRVDIGGRTATVPLYQAAFRPGISTEIHGPRYGHVPVHVTLLSSDGEHLASVTFTQLFERDNNHWVAAVVGVHRPGGHCIGTLEVAPLPASAFPETSGVPDTMFVMHGRIPKGAIC